MIALGIPMGSLTRRLLSVMSDSVTLFEVFLAKMLEWLAISFSSSFYR